MHFEGDVRSRTAERCLIDRVGFELGRGVCEDTLHTQALAGPATKGIVLPLPCPLRKLDGDNRRHPRWERKDFHEWWSWAAMDVFIQDGEGRTGARTGLLAFLSVELQDVRLSPTGSTTQWFPSPNLSAPQIHSTTGCGGQAGGLAEERQAGCRQHCQRTREGTQPRG